MVTKKSKKKKQSVYQKPLAIETPVFLIVRDTQDPESELDRFRILHPNGYCEWMNVSPCDTEFSISCFINTYKIDQVFDLSDTLIRMEKFDGPNNNSNGCLKIIEVIPL